MPIPPRIVLAAVDFSDSSRRALTFAARLARTCGATLHVLHAEDPLLATAAASRGIDLARETSDELAIFVKSAPPAADCAPSFHTEAGAPTEVIGDTARRVRADVVVIGMRGISAAEHLVFGSTTESLLRTCAVPVFAVPDGWRPPESAGNDLAGVGPVVVAVEATGTALAAAAAATRLAKALHTSTEAIHVVSKLRVLNRWQPHADQLVEAREREARPALEQGLRQIPNAVIDLRIATGNVAECIAKVIAPGPGRQPVLVIGRRPEAAGATAYRILTLARAPVLQYVEPADDRGRGV